MPHGTPPTAHYELRTATLAFAAAEQTSSPSRFPFYIRQLLCLHDTPSSIPHVYTSLVTAEIAPNHVVCIDVCLLFARTSLLGSATSYLVATSVAEV